MLTFQASKQKLITLKAKELFFLAGVLGSDRLLGVEDPFKGYLAEELAEEWEQVKATLLEKGYLKRVDKGKELAMPPTVFQESLSRDYPTGLAVYAMCGEVSGLKAISIARTSV